MQYSHRAGDRRGDSQRGHYRSLKRRAAERVSALMPVDVVDPRTTSVIPGSRLDLLAALERLEGHRPPLACARA
jgi:RNA polymerase sigma-70 factor (ECF subfamily)